MESKGNDPKHVRSTRTYIERVNKLAGIARIGDLTPSSVSVAVTELKGKNLSARAVNAHLTAIKSFSRWLKRDGRTADYALETLAKQNEQADRRRIRRALTPDEAGKVIKAAETGPEAGGLAGPDRAMLYTLALGTGFRADELATLTADRFALDADPPTVTVMACYAKNRTEAVQPIAAGLADQLRPWLASKAPGRPVFDGMTERTAEMLRVDLEAAGVDYRDRLGSRRLPRPSSRLRDESGGIGRVGQDLSNPGPAFDADPDHRLYAKASLHDIKGAVENLPDLTPRESSPEPLAMTGTDPVVTPISERLSHHFPTGEDGI